MTQLLLAGLCIIVWIVNPQYDHFFYIMLITALVVFAIYFMRKGESAELPGDFAIKKRKVLVSMWTILLLPGILVVNILKFVSIERRHDYIYLSVFLLTVLLLKRLSELIKNRQSIATLTVDGTQLYSYNGVTQTREIGDLTKIDMSLLTENIRLHFSNKSKLIVNRRIYFDHDIITLIKLLQEKRNTRVELSESVKNFVNSR